MATPKTHLTPEDDAERERRRIEFGARLRQLRLESGRTQEQIALDARLDRPFYNRLELGKRTIGVDRLEDLAFGLGVNVADLFGRG